MTVGLLVFGLVNVTQTVAQARELGPVLDSFFQQQGMGAYTDTRAAEVGGLLLALSSVLCLVVAIFFSVRRLRVRKRAFWVPVVCAAIGLVVTTIIIGGSVMADPAFFAYLQQRA